MRGPVCRSTGQVTGGAGKQRHPCGPALYNQGSTCKGYHFNHETVKHSVAEYVRGEAHSNGVELFWSLLKRVCYGTCRKMPAKHSGRHMDEFAGWHNNRSQDTIDQIAMIARRMAGKRLPYKVLVRER